MSGRKAGGYGAKFLGPNIERARTAAKRADSPGRGAPGDEWIARYLPAPFYARLPPAERSWRARGVLMLWGLGYPLEMAWSLSMGDDDELNATVRAHASEDDDQRLIALLDATADVRGDDHHLEFASFGPDYLRSGEVLIRRQLS